MTFFRAAVASLFASILAGPLSPAQAADRAELEARAAFAKVVQTAKAKQRDPFKRMINSAGLAEMAAAEKKGAKPFETLMRALAAHDPSQFTAEVKGDRATFMRHGTVRTAGGTIDQVAVFSMVREGGTWKFSLD